MNMWLNCVYQYTGQKNKATVELSGTLSTIVGGIGPTKSLVPMQTMSSVFEIICGIIKKCLHLIMEAYSP